MAGSHEHRQRAGDDQVVVVAARRGRRSSPTPRRRPCRGAPSASTRAARESTTTSRERPKSRWYAQRLAADSRSAMCANSRSRGPASSPPRSSPDELVLGQLRRGEVAEVLVEPVRHEGADDPLLPPRLRAHVAAPRPRRCSSRRGRRGRRRSSCSAPSRAASGCPDRSTPRGRAACTPRSRRPARPAAASTSRRLADERERLGRDLVGVHLVAEQQQAVRPRLAAGLQPPRERPQRVDLEALGMLARRRACTAAAAARRPGTSRTRAGPGARGSRVWMAARRAAVVGRPDPLAVQVHLVRRHRAGLEIVDHDERVVVALDVEGARRDARAPPPRTARPSRPRRSPGSMPA